MDSEETLLMSFAAQPRWVSATTVGLTILFLVIIFIFKYHLKARRASNSDQLPPGPYSWPIIGNLHMLGELPHRALKELADKYGPIMFLRLCSVSAVVVSSPEMAKLFLKTHDLIFASRPATAAGKYLFSGCKDLAFAPYGDYWRQMRKICVLELFTARRIESFQSLREEELSAMIRSIWQESEKRAKPVNLSKALSSLTANIICRMLMGTKYSTGGFRGFAELLREVSILAGAFYIGDYIPRLGWLDLQGIRRRMKKVQREFDGLTDEIIDEHIQRRTQNGGATNCFVEVLLDISESGNGSVMSRNDMKALLLDLMVGGTDTSAATLEWAMLEILRHPLVMKRLQQELESVVGNDGSIIKQCDLPNLEYLQCVVKETLRLHSTAPLLLPRESMEECTVAGYRIPAKTRVIVNAWAIGRDPLVWGADALEFKPERFMHRDIDVRGQNFELIPFGSGRRGCPGISVGLEVVALVLARLFHCFDWSLEHRDGVDEEEEAEIFGTTMPPRFPLFAVPTPRMQMIS